jgi:hypothetical protein
MNRSFEAVPYFSELQALVQNSFPGYDIILKLPGTDDIVGSQEELFFGYCDKAEEAPVLKLNLFLSKFLIFDKNRFNFNTGADFDSKSRTSGCRHIRAFSFGRCSIHQWIDVSGNVCKDRFVYPCNSFSHHARRTRHDGSSKSNTAIGTIYSCRKN